MQQIIIRADASKIIGFGHFTRSLALAEYLKDEFDCKFCTFNSVDLTPSPYQIAEITRTCKYIPIEAKDYEDYNDKFLRRLNGDEIVVLDNYYYTPQFQQKIIDKGCKLVCTDGMNNREFVADAVINAGRGKKEDFTLRKDSIFINGLNHTFLRSPFFSSKREVKDNFKIDKLVLAVGGADPYGLTNKLIKIIHSINKDLEISVIAGDTVEIDKSLIYNVSVHRRLSAGEIVELFSKSDIGFFSASTICIEALACKLPVAAGWYVDNQEDFYEFGVEEGLFLPLGNLLDKNEIIEEYVKTILNLKELPHVKDIDFAQGRRDIIDIFRKL